LLPPGLKNRFEAVLGGSQEGWWTTVLGAKDAGLALDVARDADVELPVATVVRARYNEAASSGLDDADIAAVGQLYRTSATAVPELSAGGSRGSSSRPERSGGRQAANPPGLVGRSAGAGNEG